jgi:hypothetical protein
MNDNLRTTNERPKRQLSQPPLLQHIARLLSAISSFGSNTCLSYLSSQMFFPAADSSLSSVFSGPPLLWAAVSVPYLFSYLDLDEPSRWTSSSPSYRFSEPAPFWVTHTWSNLLPEPIPLWAISPLSYFFSVAFFPARHLWVATFSVHRCFSELPLLSVISSFELLFLWAASAPSYFLARRFLLWATSSLELGVLYGSSSLH